MNFAWRIYRRLAQAFPHEFKLAYGADVTQLGKDAVEDIARRHGGVGLLRLLADIAIRVPVEYLSEMRRDLRYASRALIKSPGFALVGIISMGLGIGLTTNLYSSKWSLLFRDLPAVSNAQNLVMPEKPVSYYYVEQFREQSKLFTGVAALQTAIPFNVSLQDVDASKPERVPGQLVSSDYFSVLGVQPQRGRLLSPARDRPGDAPAVVVSDRFWRNRLHSSPGAIGQSIRLNGQLATIVGITPKNFNGALDDPASNPSELFVPVTVPAAFSPELANDVLHQLNAKDFLALICLAPGVTIDSAEAALDALTRNLDAQNLSFPPIEEKGRRVTLFSVGTRVPIPRKFKPVLAGFLIALMGLVTALACTNLANMLIARGANRRKELAIRLAVGASRFRLIRQLMAEGILLSMLGGTAGFALAYGLAVLNSQFSPAAGTPIETGLSLDWRAAVFAFALAVICGIAFSLAPALQATSARIIPALKEGSLLRLPGYRRFGLRNALMVAQVAGSLTLLLITGFIVIGISKESRVQTRFDPAAMYLFSMDPVRDGYSPEKARDFFEKLPARLAAAVSVRSVALSAQPPFSIADEDSAVEMSAEIAGAASQARESVIEQTVGVGYFAALGEPMLAGREFDRRDHLTESVAPTASVLPLILNETAQRRLFGNQNAIGKRVRDEKQSFEVVGVIRDLKNGIERQAIAYLPLTAANFARPSAEGITILVRSNPGADASNEVHNAIVSPDPNLSIFNAQTLAGFLDRSRSSTRLAVRRYAGIGIFGLVLAAIGLAGITAYAVAQRRKEIAIRTALGATKAQVLRLVLREGAALVCIGTVLGFSGAIAIAKMLSALTSIFVESLSIGAADLRLLLGAPLLLAAVTMLACYVPARRSTQIDPLKALREE